MSTENRAILIEIGVLIALPLILFVVLSETDAFERLYAVTRAYEDWDLDEKLMVISAMCVAILAFAVRRLINERRLLRAARAAHETALRNAQLEAEKATAQRADALKRDFLAVMGAELRTPLNAIIPMAELLRDSGLDADQSRCVDAIATQGESLRTMIEGVPEFTEISAGPRTREVFPIDLGGLIADITTERRPQATAKGLTLTLRLAPGPRILADPTLLWRLLDELIVNAIKFTEQGGVIVELAMFDEQHSVAACRLHVIDTGPGVPPDRQDRLFHPFMQDGESLTRRAGGLGVGLAKANAIAAQLGGALSYADDTGGGSRFTFAGRFAEAESDRWAAA